MSMSLEYYLRASVAFAPVVAQRSTDMIFSARQLQEKCQEQYKDLYLVFIDLTKAFDSVNRPGLWVILSKMGCPDKFISIVKSFHDGMFASVIDGGSMSSQFIVSCGTKQHRCYSRYFRHAAPRGSQALQHWCTTGLSH